MVAVDAGFAFRLVAAFDFPGAVLVDLMAVCAGGALFTSGAACGGPKSKRLCNELTVTADAVPSFSPAFTASADPFIVAAILVLDARLFGPVLKYSSL